MSQPVKISDSLLLDARLIGEATERSIAGQIEFWASIGRALEPLLQGDKILSLCRTGKQKTLSHCLKEVGTPKGKDRLLNYLSKQPFPHYEPSGKPGLLIRVDSNGKRTLGRFVQRKFSPVKSSGS